MKTTVIFHSNDFDGIFCREIARKFLPDSELIGWNFGDSKCEINIDGPVYILDLPPDCLSDWQHRERDIIWIDHHKSSIEKFPSSLAGYRIDGVAACRLAWQWFKQKTSDNPTPALGVGWPTKQDFVDRIVVEPIAVRLAGEYDIWDKRDERSELLQYGLRSIPLTDGIWDNLLSTDPTLNVILSILEVGRTSQKYAETVDAGSMKASFIVDWQGLKFLCLNGRGNSLTFASKDVPETGHDALLMFYFNGRVWTVSLYHARHRTDLDLSKISVKHGGGGHRGACGFTCQSLPFLPP